MSQSIRNKIASNVKRLREKQGLKREELSLLLGVDNSYISKLEKSRINITIDKLEQLANIFKVGIIELGIELDNIDTLRKVMTAIQAMPEVFSVKRIQTSYTTSNSQNFTKKNTKNKKYSHQNKSNN